MPRINPTLLDSVVFLYEDEFTAKEGLKSGGTGFLVGVQSTKFPDHSDLYVVTCKHVVKPKKGSEHSPAPVIRLNKLDGNVEVIPLDANDWYSFEDIFPGERHDLAIYELGEPPTVYQYGFPPREMLLNSENMRAYGIGPGEDVLMIGRYIDHENRQRNQPLVRFGNVSMMPGVPLRSEEGFDEEDSFVVELRSLEGFSGSPIFCYFPPYIREEGHIPIIDPYVLLGMLWSEPPQERWGESKKQPIKVFSGMSNVLPAWHINRMLDWEDFVMHRQVADKKREEDARKNPPQINLSAKGEDTFTKEDFESALRQVSRPMDDQPGEEKSETSE